MKNFSLDSQVYDKDVIIFVLTKYDINFKINLNDNNQREIKINSDNINEEFIQNIIKEINEQQLRKDIAMQNKKIREIIISSALSFPDLTNEENKQ